MRALRSTMPWRLGTIIAPTSCSTRSAPASCAGCIRHGSCGFSGFRIAPWRGVDSGLALGQRLAYANSLAFAQNFAAVLHSFRREFDAALSRAEATIDLAGKHPLPQWLAEAIICRGFALVGLGQQIEGIAQLRSGLAAWNGTGCRLFDTEWLGFFGEAHLWGGQFDDALPALDRAE